MIGKYGVDALRFYLIHGLSTEDDADFVESQLLVLYNSELANRFGNLVSRIFALCSKLDNGFERASKPSIQPILSFREGANNAFKIIGSLNSEINQLKPWEFLKDGNISQLAEQLVRWREQLSEVERLIAPVIPDGCERLRLNLMSKELPGQLFPRK